MNKKFTRNNDEDEDDFSVKDNSQLQFYTKVNRVYQHDVFIDQPFVDSSYYRTVIAMLNDAGPDDLVIFHLNSPGGLLSGLQSLVEAVKDGLFRLSIEFLSNIFHHFFELITCNIIHNKTPCLSWIAKTIYFIF